jgi:hypothetical protein
VLDQPFGAPPLPRTSDEPGIQRREDLDQHFEHVREYRSDSAQRNIRICRGW